jgi:hypothetical protein
MSRFRIFGAVFMTSVLAVALASVGCGGGDKKEGPSKTTGGPTVTTGGKTDGSATTKGEKTPLTPAGWATIKGKVTYDGTPPAPKQVNIPPDHQNKDYCLKGPTNDPTWIIGADNGVKNVVIWARPPAGKFFDIPPDHQKPKEMKVRVDQPFCAFEPHVSVLYPSFFDKESKKQKPTGQTFEVDNSAKIAHNTNVAPANTMLNSGSNNQLPAGAHREINLRASKEGQPADQPDIVTLVCDIHKWMKGYVLVFDHPYVTVTKDDGTYELQVPAGSKLQLVAWHEDAQYALPQGNGKKEGQEIDELHDKDTKPVDFKIKK